MPKKILLLALVALAIAGCGGGGPSHASGSPVPSESKGAATVSIAWPTRTARFVPLAANGVVVTLALNGVQKARQTLSRPPGTTSTAAFTGLAYGTYTVDLKAYPNGDGDGTAQAAGTAPMTVAEGAPGVANVSMATTVANLAILPATLDKNGTATVSVGATDAHGATVLLAVGDAAEAVSWSADPVVNSLGQSVPAVALSAPTGPSVILTGLHSGATQVHATLDLGLATPLTATGAVRVNAIADGTGTVTVS